MSPRPRNAAGSANTSPTAVDPTEPSDNREASSPPASTTARTLRREGLVVALIFCVALGLHFHFATFNWRVGFMPGHEFRQTQTAIAAHFIQAENDFSLAYPTPVLGKPWAIPMEFPLYQWTVVLLSNATGWPLVVAGRTVSLVCFYLTLPALYLLLGHLGLARRRRFLALAVVLSSPIYIFYSRAFLIESMALAFSAWFLAAFVETMRRRRWTWLTVAIVCGACAGMVKVTTFIVWYLPAAIYGAVLVWRHVRGREWQPLRQTVAWGCAVALPTLFASWWWVRTADAIKRLNQDAAELLISSRHTGFEPGHWLMRFDSTVWTQLFQHWHAGVTPIWTAAAVVAAGMLARSTRRAVVVALGLFFLAQFSFPRLYSAHDYYFYAAGVFLLGAVGGAVAGPWRPWVGWTATVGVLLINLSAYHSKYLPMQRLTPNGGSGLTEALKAYTPKGSAIVVAGADWSSVIPYYSERKALMLRLVRERQPDYLDRAFSALSDEDVSALVLVESARGNDDLVARAAERFDTDRSITFSHTMADVYLKRSYRQSALLRLAIHAYDGLSTNQKAGEPSDEDIVAVSPAMAATAFPMMSPAPSHYRLRFGISLFDLDGVLTLGAHPDSELIFAIPAGATELECEFGILQAAYDREGVATNGVEFFVHYASADGSQQEVFRRVLDPGRNPADRGHQSATLILPAPPTGAMLVFATRDNGEGSFDWAYWRKIHLR